MGEGARKLAHLRRSSHVRQFEPPEGEFLFDAAAAPMLDDKGGDRQRQAYAPTGGIVAAPTTSLPETLGGIRNWDYRFCWLRDATLSLLALMNAGYYEEASAWRDWLLRAVAGVPPQAQIMYSITGENRLTEWEIGWLPGYEGAKPVRIGNGAHGQIQIDVYGEVMDALYQAQRGGLAGSEDAWNLLQAFLAHLATIWREPDRGIWESRRPPRHFTFSKVMAWVAFDRGAKIASEFGLKGPVERWSAVAREIHDDVCSNGYDEELGSFVQSYGSKWLDGSLLLIPTTGFLPLDDPRILGTVRAVEGRLLQDGFVMRHDPAETETGLAHGEGAFLACCFWLVDALVMTGRAEEGRTPVRPAAEAAQRRRPAVGGVRRRGAAPGRQLPAGLLAHCAGQFGVQSGAVEQARRAARG